jgi:hypothetical protein
VTFSERIAILRYHGRRFGGLDARGKEMVNGVKLRAWTTVDVRMSKTLAHEKTKTTEIARRLSRTVKATHQQAMRLGVTLGGWKKRSCGGDVIYKQFIALPEAWSETRKIGELETKVDDAAIRMAPVIFQRHVAAVADLRVTIVGSEVFAAAVDLRDECASQNARQH